MSALLAKAGAAGAAYATHKAKSFVTDKAKAYATDKAKSFASQKAKSIVGPTARGVIKQAHSSAEKKTKRLIGRGVRTLASKAASKLDSSSDKFLHSASKIHGKLAENNPLYKGLGKLVNAPSGSSGENGKPMKYKTGKELDKLGYKKDEIPESEKAKYHKNPLISAGRTLHAGLGLAQDVTNPFALAKTAKNAVKGKGVVLPGSSYIGPGNEIASKGKRAKSDADAAAYAHDKDYDRSLSKGVKASALYTGFGNSDKRLLKRASAETKQGLAVHLGIGAKKLASKVGLTPSNTD